MIFALIEWAPACRSRWHRIHWGFRCLCRSGVWHDFTAHICFWPAEHADICRPNWTTFQNFALSEWECQRSEHCCWLRLYWERVCTMDILTSWTSHLQEQKRLFWTKSAIVFVVCLPCERKVARSNTLKGCDQFGAFPDIWNVLSVCKMSWFELNSLQGFLWCSKGAYPKPPRRWTFRRTFSQDRQHIQWLRITVLAATFQSKKFETWGMDFTLRGNGRSIKLLGAWNKMEQHGTCEIHTDYAHPEALRVLPPGQGLQSWWNWNRPSFGFDDFDVPWCHTWSCCRGEIWASTLCLAFSPSFLPEQARRLFL